MDKNGREGGSGTPSEKHPGHRLGETRIEENAHEIKVVSDTGFPIGQQFKLQGAQAKTPVDQYFLGYFEGVLSAVHLTRFHYG